jgi:hypothetical protein
MSQCKKSFAVVRIVLIWIICVGGILYSSKTHNKKRNWGGNLKRIVVGKD